MEGCRWDGEPDTGVPHYYDVAQIISSDLKYVGWKAFWPTLSDYSVDAWAKTFEPLIWVNDADMVPAGSEPDKPFVVGEGDFQLGHGYPAQFRGVEVLGLTDYHDAKDPQKHGEAALDIEVQYQLNEVFNPWSLVDAVHKETKRWVEFFTGDGTWSSQTLTYRPFANRTLGEWYEYCSFTERVLVDGVLLTPWDARIAKGEIFVVVSADTEPKDGLVARLLEAIKDDVGGACAKTIPLYRKILC